MNMKISPDSVHHIVFETVPLMIQSILRDRPFRVKQKLTKGNSSGGLNICHLIRFMLVDLTSADDYLKGNFGSHFIRLVMIKDAPSKTAKQTVEQRGNTRSGFGLHKSRRVWTM